MAVVLKNYDSDKEIVIEMDSINIKKSENKNRGVKIIVDFACESGHYFNQQIEFNKGLSYISVINGSVTGCNNTIWRD